MSYDLVKSSHHKYKAHNDKPTFVTGDGFRKPAHQEHIVPKMHKPKPIAVTVPDETLLSAGGTLTATIESGNIQQVAHIELELQCENTDASNTVTPTLASFMCERIEIFANSGGKKLQTLYDVPMFGYLANYTTEQLTMLANLNNTSTSFGATALGTSALKNYWVPLPLNVLQGLNLASIKGDILIKFFFREAVESGSGDIVVNAANLHIWEIAGPAVPEPYQKFETNFLEWEPQEFGTQTITASTASNFKLNSLTGTCVAMIVAIRSSVTTANIHTFAALGTAAADGTIQLKEGTKPIFDSPISWVAQRYIENGHIFNSTFFNTIPLTYIQFADQKVFLNGAVDGYLQMDGDITVSITPGSAFTTGSYDVVVYACMLKHLRIKNGVLEAL